MKDNETRQEFIRLRAKGKSFRDISDALDVGTSTLVRWSKEYEKEIRELKEMELDALRTEYGATFEAHLRRLGGTLKRISEEIDGRDFSEVPTEKLLAVALKYEDALQRDIDAPEPMSEDAEPAPEIEITDHVRELIREFQPRLIENYREEVMEKEREDVRQEIKEEELEDVRREIKEELMAAETG